MKITAENSARMLLILLMKGVITVLTYYVEHTSNGKRSIEKILHVEGELRAEEMEKLSTCLFDALNSSSHLIINIERLYRFDSSFIMLICSFRKTAQLLNKRLTICGEPLENVICIHEKLIQPVKKKCEFVATADCYLWEKFFKGDPRLAKH
jgi:anti-anti-sigma regulatory factor